MRFLIAAMVAAFLLSSCASIPSDDQAKFRAYPACAIDFIGGRQLYDPGMVVGEIYLNNERLYRFIADRNSSDPRAVETVKRIRRPCEAAQGVMGAGTWGDFADPSKAPSDKGDRQ